MTTTDPVLGRVVRRETHSPRTAATAIVLVVLMLGLAYLGVEIVLRLLSLPPLLLSPGQGLDWLAALPTAQPAAAVVGGSIVVALIGLVLIVLALGAGRLPKHRMGEEAVVVDNGVIAQALAQHVSDELSLGRENVTVGVAHRAADITVRPQPGLTVDPAAVRAAAEEELTGYRLTPALRVRIRIEKPALKEPLS
ncbi:DNA/RNA endonuclease G [Cnuibacter physcomitrellae]|uniref:DNA/RNA endonuclease G n=1 Tax=Cnuibacter physcomitrellae TaxID=1619308 RepID=UPI00217610EE|nr:DNA/RNA endonuclease G [Cnuibacter physcomitrellae]MCS5497145.1 DNA/RNA endonuclease G [Cnuibacter physcomitrellae]